MRSSFCYSTAVMLFKTCVNHFTRDSDRLQDLWAHHSSSIWSVDPEHPKECPQHSRLYVQLEVGCTAKQISQSSSVIVSSSNRVTAAEFQSSLRCYGYVATAGSPPSIFSSWHLWILCFCWLDQPFTACHSHSSSSVNSSSNKYGSVW